MATLTTRTREMTRAIVVAKKTVSRGIGIARSHIHTDANSVPNDITTSRTSIRFQIRSDIRFRLRISYININSRFDDPFVPPSHDQVIPDVRCVDSDVQIDWLESLVLSSP